MSVWVRLLVNKLHIKKLSHVDRHDFHVDVSKSFSKAYALATQKWTESHHFSFLSVRSQIKRTLAVKTFWDKLVGSLPL